SLPLTIRSSCRATPRLGHLQALPQAEAAGGAVAQRVAAVDPRPRDHNTKCPARVSTQASKRVHGEGDEVEAPAPTPFFGVGVLVGLALPDCKVGSRWPPCGGWRGSCSGW